MLRSVVVATILAICAGPGALAEEAAAATDCGPSLSESVFNTIGDIRARKVTLQDKLGWLDTVAAQCSGNAFAQHYAAMAHYTQVQQLNKPGAPMQPIWDELQKAFAYSQAYWAIEDRDQKFGLFNGAREIEVPIPSSEPTNLRKDAVSALLSLGATAGLVHPYIADTSIPPACRDEYFWDVSAARSFQTSVPAYSAIALAFASRFGEACSRLEGIGNDRSLQELLVAIRLKHAKAIAANDPDTAFALVGKIEAFRDSVLKPGEATNFSWSDYEAVQLKQVMALLPEKATIPTGKEDPLVSAGTVPVEQWFTEGADKAKVRASMGRTFNAYAAARGLDGFVSAMGKMYAEGTKSPNPKAAYSEIYKVAQAYNTGSWRSAETRDLTFSDTAYKWLKNLGE